MATDLDPRDQLKRLQEENTRLLVHIRELKRKEAMNTLTQTGEVQVTQREMDGVLKRKAKLNEQAIKLKESIEKAWKTFFKNHKRIKKIDKTYQTWKLKISNKKNGRTMLSHVKNRDEGKCARFKQMFKYGSRVQFKYPKILDFLDYNFSKSKEGPWLEVGISRKQNGIHFSAVAEVGPDFHLKFIQVQGKRGEWRREDNFHVIREMLNQLSLTVNFREIRQIFKREGSHYIVAGELLGPKYGSDPTDNPINILSYLREDLDNLTILVYDVRIYIPCASVREKPEIQSFLPSYRKTIFDTWRQHNTDVAYVLFDDPICISKEEWQYYRNYQQRFKLPQPKLYLISRDGDSLTFGTRYDEYWKDILFVPDVTSNFLKKISEGVTALTNREKDAISEVVRQKKYLNESGSFCLYQLIERYRAENNGTFFTSSESNHVQRLINASSVSGRIMLKSWKATNQLRRYFLHCKLPQLHKWAMYGNRNNHEGLILDIHREKATTYHKCKKSYNTPSNPECTFFEQVFGVVLGYRMDLSQNIVGVKRELPLVLIVYVVNTSENRQRLSVIAKAHFNWKYNHPSSVCTWVELVDLETVSVDSTGISEKAAKQLLLRLLMSATNENVKFFKWNGPDSDYSLNVKISGKDYELLFKPGTKRSYLTYALFTDKKVWIGMTMSQLIYSPGRYRADGWFIRAVVVREEILPPLIVHEICSLSRHYNEELPIDLKVILGRFFPRVPCLIPFPTDQFFWKTIKERAYVRESEVHNPLCYKAPRQGEFGESCNNAPLWTIGTCNMIELSNAYARSLERLKRVQTTLPSLGIASLGLGDSLNLPDLIEYFKLSYKWYLYELAWLKTMDYDDFEQPKIRGDNDVNSLSSVPATNLAIEYQRQFTREEPDIPLLNCSTSSTDTMISIIKEYLDLLKKSETLKVTQRTDKAPIPFGLFDTNLKKEEFYREYFEGIRRSLKCMQYKHPPRPCDTFRIFCWNRPFHYPDTVSDESAASAGQLPKPAPRPVTAVPGLSGVVVVHPNANPEDREIMLELINNLIGGQLTTLNPILHTAAKFILHVRRKAAEQQLAP
jgi:hypothetical protein